MIRRSVLMLALLTFTISFPVGAQVSAPDLDTRDAVDPNPVATDAEADWVPVFVPEPLPIATPGERLLHTAILDPVGQRMVVFGGDGFGFSYGDVWSLGLSAEGPNWTRLATAGSPPAERRDHTAVYDPVRRRMIVFGGATHAGTALSELWTLSLDGTPEWTPLVASGSAPSARFSHTAIYDPIRDRMIVFGGYAGTFLGDVHQLSLSGTPTWSPISPAGSGPAGRNAMTAVYDPVGDRMLVFGGWDGGNFRNDLWSLSLSGAPAWQALSPAGVAPAPRRHYSAHVDPIRSQLVITGGLGYDPFPQLRYYADTWTLSLAGSLQWESVSTATSPPARNGHRAVFDPVSDRSVLFGGYDGTYRSDAWILDRSGTPTWRLVVPQAGAPSPRRDHVAIHDPVRDRLIIFGGWDGDYKNDVWAYAHTGNVGWSEIQVAGTPPPPRFAHAAAYDPVGDRIIVFGGYDGAFLNDAWALALSGTPTWMPLAPLGDAPTGRNAMTAIYDSARERILVFGGFDGAQFLNDLWALNLTGSPEWAQLEQRREPAPRRHYAAVYDEIRDQLVVHAGYDLTYRDDLWALDLDRERWFRPVAGRLRPVGRNGHRATVDAVRNRMIIFGGYGGSGSLAYFNDTWALSLGAPRRWSQIMPAGTPPAARLLHSATYDPVRDRVLVFGGASQLSHFEDRLYNDLWALEFSGDAPAPEDAQAEPASVVPARFDLAIHGVTPNPARGAFAITFTIPEAGDAALELFSVTGARVERRELAAYSAGRHTVGFDAPLRPGVYWARLSVGARSESTRIAVVP